MPNDKQSPRPKGGRPAKFNEPSRPVTVTLPESALRRLSAIHAGDRARAIVKALDSLSEGPDKTVPAVNELPISNGRTLLTVADNRLLRAIPWLTLIEIAPGRHLISVESGTPIERFEVALVDILETDVTATDAERDAIRQLLHSLRAPRRNQAVTTEEILVIEKTGK